MANLSQRTGTTPVNTRIGLANNAASNVQNFNGYDSQELIGHVFIDGTTDYRAAVRIVVVKNGAGIYEVAATDIAGDDISGSPIVSFSMSGSILQATLPNITGFSSAYIDYHLVSPKLNATYPLSVDVGSVVAGGNGFYEESDSWSPTVSTVANISGTASVSNASYTRVGRMVFGSFIVTGVNHVANGTISALVFEVPYLMGDNSGISAASVGGTGRVVGPSAGRVIPVVAVDATSSNNTTIQMSWESDTSIGNITQVSCTFYYHI